MGKGVASIATPGLSRCVDSIVAHLLLFPALSVLHVRRLFALFAAAAALGLRPRLRLVWPRLACRSNVPIRCPDVCVVVARIVCASR